MKLAALDWLILIALVITTFRGARRGLVQELMSLLTWVFSYWGAKHFGALIATVLPLQSATDEMRLAVGFALMFVIGMVGMALLGSAVKRLLGSIGAGSADASLGALFGLCKGLAIVFVAQALIYAFGLQLQSWYAESMVAPYILQAFQFVLPFLPIGLSSKINLGI